MAIEISGHSVWMGFLCFKISGAGYSHCNSYVKKLGRLCLIEVIRRRKKTRAESKGKSFPERNSCMCPCIISRTGDLLHLFSWINAFILDWSFSISDCHLLVNCNYRYLEEGERGMTQILCTEKTLIIHFLFIVGKRS